MPRRCSCRGIDTRGRSTEVDVWSTFLEQLNQRYEERFHALEKERALTAVSLDMNALDLIASPSDAESACALVADALDAVSPATSDSR